MSRAGATAQLPPDRVCSRARGHCRCEGRTARDLPGAAALGAMALPPGGTARAGMRADADLDCDRANGSNARHLVPAPCVRAKNFEEEE